MAVIEICELQRRRNVEKQVLEVLRKKRQFESQRFFGFFTLAVTDSGVFWCNEKTGEKGKIKSECLRACVKLAFKNSGFWSLKNPQECFLAMMYGEFVN